MWYQAFPGYPGPLDPRRPLGGIASPALPAVPLHPGGLPAAAGTMLDGLARFGVPVGYTPNGMPYLRMGGAGEAEQPFFPPHIQGMPQIPSPPTGMFTGSLNDILQEATPVQPVDPSNHVYQHMYQERLAAMAAQQAAYEAALQGAALAAGEAAALEPGE